MDRAHAEAAVATARAQLAEARVPREELYPCADQWCDSAEAAAQRGERLYTVRFAGDYDGGDSVLRVRLDIDESDVSKLRVGQRAYVTAEAYGTHKFWGRAFRVRNTLGRKNVRADEPSEHVDTKILETLVELDAGQHLPLGLRVDSYVQREESAAVK